MDAMIKSVRRPSGRLAVYVLALTLAAAACGGGGDEEPATAPVTTAAPATTALSHPRRPPGFRC